MKKWFTIEEIDSDTYSISEYRHWEETHCYLLRGEERSLLIDTGLGISNIYDEVIKLTDKPVTAVATHIVLADYATLRPHKIGHPFRCIARPLPSAPTTLGCAGDPVCPPLHPHF